MKEKTRLKKLKITSVDMCGAGMNQDAHINLYKSNDKEGEPQTMDAETVKKGFMEALKELFGGKPAEVQKAQPMPINKAMNVVTEAEEMTHEFYKCIDSIICDPTLSNEGRTEMLKKNFEEFSEFMNNAMPSWAEGETVMPDGFEKAERRNPFVDYDNEDEDTDEEETEIDRDEGGEETEKSKTKTEKAMEGEDEMRIDKSKFTAEELVQYEALVNKASVQEIEQPAPVQLDPMVKKALDEVAEIKKGLMMKQFTETAQKYAIMGKNPEELAKSLYEMNERDPEIYKQYVAVLDEGLSMVNKSGMFAEIGKSAHGTASTAVGKVEGIAKGYMQADPTLSYHAAMAKAWENNPDLVREYEKEY